MKKCLVSIIFGFFSTYAGAKDVNPLEEWEFVAVISRTKDGNVSIIVLKDSARQFIDKKSVEVLRARFKDKEPVGPTGWIYSMAFKDDKRFDQSLNVGEKFSSDMERNLLPFATGPNGPPKPAKKK